MGHKKVLLGLLLMTTDEEYEITFNRTELRTLFNMMDLEQFLQKVAEMQAATFFEKERLDKRVALLENELRENDPYWTYKGDNQ
jgi:hypothetical protein